MTDRDDFFDVAEPAVSLDAGRYGLNERGSRYIYPPPPGEQFPPRQRDWRRMTNLVSAFSDQEKLQDWLFWKAFEGLRADEVIFDEWMAEPLEHMSEDERKALSLQYAARAREAGKAKDAARRGTARHLMMDAWFARGERTGTRSMQAQLDSAIDVLDDAGLDVLDTEFRVWLPGGGGTIGTSDLKVMCRCCGGVGILDWKTQARFWTWQEICGQLAGYSDAPWVWRGPHTSEGHWERQEPNTLLGHAGGELVGKPVALVAHMPQAPGPGQLPVELWEVDVQYGREVLAVASENVRLRSIGKSVAVGRRPAGLHPASAARRA